MDDGNHKVLQDTLKESKQNHIGTNDDLLLGTYVTALASQCLYFIVDLTSQSGIYISDAF